MVVVRSVISTGESMRMNREAEGGSVAFFNKEKKPENGTAMCAIHESVEFILNSRINRQPWQTALETCLTGYRVDGPDRSDRELVCEEIVRAIQCNEKRVSNVQAVAGMAPDGDTPFIRVSWNVASTGRYDELVLWFPFG